MAEANKGSTNEGPKEDTKAAAPLGPYGRPIYLTNPGDDLLVENPIPDTNVDNKKKKKDTKRKSGKKSRRMSEAQRMEQLITSPEVQQTMNGSNHRPLVGGFAAAAYNAAREHHFTGDQEDPKKGKKRVSICSFLCCQTGAVAKE